MKPWRSEQRPYAKIMRMVNRLKKRLSVHLKDNEKCITYIAIAILHYLHYKSFPNATEYQIMLGEDLYGDCLDKIFNYSKRIKKVTILFEKMIKNIQDVETVKKMTTNFIINVFSFVKNNRGEDK